MFIWIYILPVFFISITKVNITLISIPLDMPITYVVKISVCMKKLYFKNQNALRYALLSPARFPEFGDEIPFPSMRF